MTLDLPIREVMLDRLREASNHSFLEEDLYPLLLQEAGKDHTPESLVQLLVGAVHACEGIAKGRAVRLAADHLDKLVGAIVFEADMERYTLRLLKREQRVLLEPWRKRG